MNGRGVFSRRLLIVLIGLAVMSFLLSFILVGYGEDLSPARSLGTDTYSFSAIGHRGLRFFLERLGLEVFISRDDWPTGLHGGVALIAAEPVPGISIDGYGLYEAWEEAAFEMSPFVVVLPKWRGMSDASGRRLDRVALIPRGAVGETVGTFLDSLAYSPTETVRRVAGERRIACMADDGTEYEVAVRELQLLVLPEPFRAVVTCEDMALVAHLPATDETSDTWVVSDPDVLNNQGLLRGDHAVLVRDLFLERVGAPVAMFDEMLHGYQGRSRLIAEMVRFPLVLVMIHGLLLSALVVWSGSGRVGRPRKDEPRFADGKLVLIDNSAKLLGLGGHSRETLKQYYEQVLRAVGAYYFLPSDLGLDELEGRLQVISQSRDLDVDLPKLRERIDRISHRRGPIDHAVRLARRLHQWRSEMTYER